MTWLWEKLTAPEFARAVEAAGGVCVVPLGVIEKHGEHLPLGTDMFVAREVAERAAVIEPAVIFPPYYLTQINEARHVPGTLAIRTELMLELLDNLCDEIARNGLHKILLLNGHGGNECWLSLFAMHMLERRRPFTLYIARLHDYHGAVADDPAWKAQMVSAIDAHGGEMETSAVLAVCPDLVRMDAVAGAGGGMGRLAQLPVLTPSWWYAEAPQHYYGDATHATAEKGEFLLQRYSQRVADIIKAVKADTKARELEDEFFARVSELAGV